MRLFSFVASEPAKHELHGFVTHSQRQNSTQFRAQNVAKEHQKNLTSLLKPDYKLEVLSPASLPSTNAYGKTEFRAQN